MQSDLDLLRLQARRRYRTLVERSKKYGVQVIPFEQYFQRIVESYSQGFKCFYCGRKMRIKGNRNDFEDVFSVDHFIPLSAGGTNDYNNLVVCCTRCNLVKGTLRGTTYQRLLSILDTDPKFKEQYLKEAYECALARKLERLEHESMHGRSR